jgi:hypothetical protein
MFRITLLAGATVLLSAIAPANATTWRLLGTQAASASADHDTFYVGRSAGRFGALKFRVLDRRIALADVKVIYGNGSSEHLDVREHLRPGDTTPAYDLKGDRRFIDRIEVLYQTNWKHAALGRLQIFGLLAGEHQGNGGGEPLPGEPAGRFEHLGSTTVGRLIDHDTFWVGHEKGSFRTLKFDVSANDVHVYTMRVRFSNGETQNFDVNAVIRAGRSTPALDLAGRKRFIERVDFVYRTLGAYGPRGMVTLFGGH